MPVTKCPNGKWKIGSGKCVFTSKRVAEGVFRAFTAAGGEVKQKELANFEENILPKLTAKFEEKGHTDPQKASLDLYMNSKHAELLKLILESG